MAAGEGYKDSEGEKGEVGKELERKKQSENGTRRGC